MLILDKQKAVERVMALTMGGTTAEPEPPLVRGRGRTPQRIATYERRESRPETVARAETVAPPALEPKGSRKRRRVAPTVGPAPA